MTNTQMLAISSPANGLMVFNTDAGALYYYNGTSWLSKENTVSGFVNTSSPLQRATEWRYPKIKPSILEFYNQGSKQHRSFQ
jgi:hypothetical protein